MNFCLHHPGAVDANSDSTMILGSLRDWNVSDGMTRMMMMVGTECNGPGHPDREVIEFNDDDCHAVHERWTIAHSSC
eukprot:2562551-Rhodomonas_salina.2